MILFILCVTDKYQVIFMGVCVGRWVGLSYINEILVDWILHTKIKRMNGIKIIMYVGASYCMHMYRVYSGIDLQLCIMTQSSIAAGCT